jgi:hypothetical protein
VHPECAICGFVVRLTALHLYRVRDAPEEALRHHQCDVRVRLSPKLPKHADAEPKVIQRERGITHECHVLECDLDQRGVALLLQIPERRGMTARGTRQGRGGRPNVIGRGVLWAEPRRLWLRVASPPPDAECGPPRARQRSARWAAPAAVHQARQQCVGGRLLRWL